MDQYLSCGLELKFADGAAVGAFNGYASVFGIVDGHGDVVAPGAFKNTLAEKRAQGRTIPMYMQHGARLGGDPRPVGVWTSVDEDDRGLKVSGRIVGLDTDQGKYNYALVKDGAVGGISIGYKTVKARFGKTAAEPRRTLQEVNLFEISLVDDPANTLARVESIKSLNDVKTIRELEDALGDQGFSRSERVKAVAVFKSFFRRDAGMPNDAPRDEVAAAEVLAIANRFKALRAS